MELVRRWIAKILGWPQTCRKLNMIKSPSSVGVTATAILTLNSASKYYSEILKPTYDDFFGNPATLRSAFILASVLFHFRDWLFVFHKTALERHFGKTLKAEQALWAEVEKTGTRFGFIRDLANASKHVHLKHHPSTSTTHIANTSITVVSSVVDHSSTRTATVTMKDGSNDIV
jgi:hypothetical protein